MTKQNRKTTVVLIVAALLGVAIMGTALLATTRAQTAVTPTAHDGPATVLFQGQIFAFCRGNDNGMYYQKMSWHEWQPMGGPISSTPSLVVKDNTLYVFVRGMDGICYYRTTTDGDTFSEWHLQSQGAMA